MYRPLLASFALSFVVSSLTAADPKAAVMLREALDVTADVVLEEKSLIELRDYLKGKLKADVQFDNSAVAAIGLDPNAPTFTVKSRNARVRDGIRAALAPHHLVAVNVGGALFIGTESDAIARQLRQRVGVDGEPTALSAVLKSLGDESGANVVLDPRITPKMGDMPVKLKLDDVPLESAVRLVAEVGGLSTVRMNNVLFVTTEERAEKLRPVSDPPTQPAAPSPAPGVLPFGLGGLLKPVPPR